ncbi:DsbA family protein [Trichocoleus sp. FACHB-262]|uniref:DsbA family protein n=1 Tax=Trichocoleus sp. FACHB-262 TaxID=2692869 RepID=UPI0018EFBC25|nr:thioredoxin domain-containing protein [Trichocoleus sp. FACHB-262]
MKIWQGFVVLFCCCLWMVGMPPAEALDPSLEQAVLEIIEQHPEAILKSLADYQQQQEQQKQAQTAAIAQVRPQLEHIIRTSPSLGDVHQAKVTLIEFADFECPFCIQAHRSLKQFLAQHPEVALVYKHFPLTDIHPESLPAAKAVWATGQQGHFWPFHDALFERQPNLADPLYLAIATQLKLDLDQFNRDRHSEAATQAIAQDMQLANNLKIEGTPSFLALTSKTVELISGADFQALTKIVNRVTP